MNQPNHPTNAPSAWLPISTVPDDTWVLVTGLGVPVVTRFSTEHEMWEDADGSRVLDSDRALTSWMPIPAADNIWLPTDTAPGDTWVLIRRNGVHIPSVARFDTNYELWEDTAGDRVGPLDWDITGWMPIPSIFKPWLDQLSPQRRQWYAVVLTYLCEEFTPKDTARISEGLDLHFTRGDDLVILKRPFQAGSQQAVRDAVSIFGDWSVVFSESSPLSLIVPALRLTRKFQLTGSELAEPASNYDVEQKKRPNPQSNNVGGDKLVPDDDLHRQVAELIAMIAHLQPVGKIGEIQRLFNLQRPTTKCSSSTSYSS